MQMKECVLVVDDDREIVGAIALLLEDEGYRVLRAYDGLEALDLVASKFQAIKREYGNGALAGFACSRSTNEDIYMLQKMVRTCFGNHNTDNCARV